MHLIDRRGNQEIYWSAGNREVRRKCDSGAWSYQLCDGGAMNNVRPVGAVIVLDGRRHDLLLNAYAKLLVCKEELATFIMRDFIPLIDHYLFICYQIPDVPDLCENVHALAPNLDTSKMVHIGQIDNGYIRYAKIMYHGQEHRADNLAGTDCWFLYDKYGRDKGPCDTLISVCLKHRAEQLALSPQEIIPH